MSDTDIPAETPAGSTQPPAARKRGSGLNSLLLADLKAMAGGLGIPGAAAMKKAQLVDAIKAAQSGGQSGKTGSQADQQPATQAPGVQAASEKPRVVTRTRGRAAAREAQPPAAETPRAETPRAETPRAETPRAETPQAETPQAEARPAQTGQADGPRGEAEAPRRTRARRGDGEQPAESREETPRGDTSDQGEQQQSRRERRVREERGQDAQTGSKDGRRDGKQDGTRDGNKDGAGKDGRGERSRQQDKQDRQQQDRQQQDKQDRQQQERQQQDKQDRQQQERQQQDKQDRQQDRGQHDDDDEDGRGRNRRRRGRERNRPGTGSRNEPDTTVLEDDVLVPAAGILDVLDNYAFVRTTGYLPGPDDVYLSLSMVRKFGLRRGDAVVGQVRQPREGERKEKFNPMVRLESVNGSDPEAARDRVEFSRLTPVHPSERLRLETGADNLIGRIIDLAAPVGKGQRGLIVSPAKAGKTTLLQAVAASITANNPECHLMVVLVDERPEEVTDFERSVKGEVIASTFDRPPADHTLVAELAIERAKRLVELGHDVVVLLDGITRLARAYNLATPASGRMLSGGVDAAAMYPPKKFFGAARNIENGGSLTILATAVVDSGSAMDEVIFEEFTGTGNMELRLSRGLADKRLFPAIDVAASGTRHEELLFSPEEAAVVGQLRGALAERSEQEAAELLHERLRGTQSNVELLMKMHRAGS
ncbi:transcription termination factor Rho [Nocardioides ochotonae]|uniref:transcription termination factor Rho n=1 Tax=Nocardioides ochotonae TaxID=2685869 RepID=UPI0031334ED9